MSLELKCIVNVWILYGTAWIWVCVVGNLYIKINDLNFAFCAYSDWLICAKHPSPMGNKVIDGRDLQVSLHLNSSEKCRQFFKHTIC